MKKLLVLINEAAIGAIKAGRNLPSFFLFHVLLAPSFSRPDFFFFFNLNLSNAKEVALVANLGHNTFFSNLPNVLSRNPLD